MISKRARSIDTSGIRRFFELGAAMNDPINLSIGQPAFDAFPAAREAAIEAIDSRRSGYTVTQGIEPLRTKLLERYLAPRGLSADDYDSIVTVGVSGGFLLSYMVTLDPGDEVLIPDPFFGLYRDLAKLLHAEPVCYNTYPDFRISLGELESLITEKTRAIVVNTPGNPTGAILDEAQIQGVVEIARRRNLWVLYDEIYSSYSYDAPHVDILGRYENTIVLSGASKSLGMPGWRIGWIIAPKFAVQEMRKIQQYTFVCAPSICQWGALGALDEPFDPILAEYRKKRDFIYNALKDQFEVVKPGGAFYIFPRAPGGNAEQFVSRCVAEQLLVVPGSVFSRQDTHFRISFSAPQRDLDRGVEVLRKLARG